jgi:hypothetical protein
MTLVIISISGMCVEYLIDFYVFAKQSLNGVIEQQTDRTTELTEPSKLQDYINLNYGIKMKYPRDYEVMTSPTKILFEVPSNSSSVEYLETIDISIRDSSLDAPYDLERLLDSAISAKESNPTFSLLNSTADYTLAGRPAYRLEYTIASDDGREVRVIEIGVAVEKNEFVIRFTADASSKYQEHSMIVEETLNNFEILPEHIEIGRQLNASFITDVKITLKRFGSPVIAFPSYSLEINGDGKVIYNGFENVNVTGEHIYYIPKERVQQLVDKSRSIGYFSLENKYPDSITMSDMPIAETSVTINGVSKSIYDYLQPDLYDMTLTSLRELEEEIDTSANSAQLVG